jgi:hypothetical protein
VTPTFAPNVTQLTRDDDVGSGPQHPWITDDGQNVAYDNGIDVFLTSTDGRQRRSLTQVRPGSGACTRPRPNRDGNRVVMVCSADVTGSNPDGNPEVVLLRGIDFVPITTSPTQIDPDNENSTISADGHSVVFASKANYTEQNPGGSRQIFLWREGLIPELIQITRGTGVIAGSGVSADGRIVLFGQEDPDQVTLFQHNLQTGTSAVVLGPLALRSCPPGRGPSCPQGAIPSRDLQSLVPVTTTDLASGVPGARYRMYLYPIGGRPRFLTEIPDNLTAAALAVNEDGSRIAALIGDAISAEPRRVLFTAAGERALPGVPPDAREFSLDCVGRRLAFLSSQNLTGNNPGRRRQLFVAQIALDSDTPTPTATATRTRAPLVLVFGIDAAQNLIYVSDSQSLPDSGLIQVDAELISYGRNGRAGGVLFDAVRGACGTTPASHAAGAGVTVFLDGCPTTSTPTPVQTTPQPTPPLGPCLGDCDGSGDVTVNEIVAMVNIALGNAAPSACHAGDADGSGNITINEIIGAVANALNGCG